jgi:hypothetical protein
LNLPERVLPLLEKPDGNQTALKIFLTERTKRKLWKQKPIRRTIQENDAKPSGFVNRALNAIEVIGNKLPDPAALFLILLICRLDFVGDAFDNDFCGN